jgi:hypothetical protein
MYAPEHENGAIVTVYLSVKICAAAHEPLSEPVAAT